ncbi:Bro-N domain-containing protein [Brevundimonas sp. SL130]|uniref:BRO-N domain-containing protein n=1 Tax=Brevundimonas sp. SL130 TaxID=2995143 RepID=UPI00226D1C6A|nr:BRO family protein [Brevundimonas sp. SL130]WAC60784.1 BRO family protein [Brevundimonas sp. SL130]
MTQTRASRRVSSADNDIITIRSTVIDGEPWFVSADICRALGLASNTATNGIGRRLFKPDELKSITRGGVQNTPPLLSLFEGSTSRLALLSEPALYKLIMRSEKAEALAFQHWLASEVLPSIRKTGTYSLADHGREAMPLPMDIAESFAVVLGEALETPSRARRGAGRPVGTRASRKRSW